jgi:hypothetical protein
MVNRVLKKGASFLLGHTDNLGSRRAFANRCVHHLRVGLWWWGLRPLMSTSYTMTFVVSTSGVNEMDCICSEKRTSVSALMG